MSPKWFTNLTLGLEQSFVQYSGELSGMGAYLPIKNILHRLPNDLPAQPIILSAFYFNYKLFSFSIGGFYCLFLFFTFN